jgi:acyl-CoA hydrolase
MLAPLTPVRDLRLSGQVIYTGTSSMEVAVKMEAVDGPGREQTLMLGRFSMVCRDAHTHKARAVPALALETPEDAALHAIGQGGRAPHWRRGALLMGCCCSAQGPPAEPRAALVGARPAELGRSRHAARLLLALWWRSSRGPRCS